MLTLSNIFFRPILIVFTVIVLLGVTNSIVFAHHRVNGSGTCWASTQAWQYHAAEYYIDTTIPGSWHTPIQNAGSVWNAVTPATFVFTKVGSLPASGNKLDFINLGSMGPVASNAKYLVGNTIIKDILTYNSAKPWSADGSWSGGYDVQSVALHEFGHWLSLNDIYTAGCESAKMWHTIGVGQIRRSLVQADRDGINWQYAP